MQASTKDGHPESMQQLNAFVQRFHELQGRPQYIDDHYQRVFFHADQARRQGAAVIPIPRKVGKIAYFQHVERETLRERNAIHALLELYFQSDSLWSYLPMELLTHIIVSNLSTLNQAQAKQQITLSTQYFNNPERAIIPYSEPPRFAI